VAAAGGESGEAKRGEEESRGAGLEERRDEGSKKRRGGEKECRGGGEYLDGEVDKVSIDEYPVGRTQGCVISNKGKRGINHAACSKTRAHNAPSPPLKPPQQALLEE
jgi:hypothetical protein